MKTRNSNLQKAELFSLNSMMILFAAILVLNSNVTATEKGTEALAEMFINEKEAALNIESWMLNDSYFSHFNSFETANESALELESWMVNENKFGFGYLLESRPAKTMDVSNLTDEIFLLEKEVENSLNFEYWMIDSKIFPTAFSFETESEKSLELEEWMLNESTFSFNSELEIERENALVLESWMTNDSIFQSVSTKGSKSETLAMNHTDIDKKITTIEYKDVESGKTFLFKLAETEEPELQLEKWMVDPRVWNRKMKTK